MVTEKAENMPPSVITAEKKEVSLGKGTPYLAKPYAPAKAVTPAIYGWLRSHVRVWNIFRTSLYLV